MVPQVIYSLQDSSDTATIVIELGVVETCHISDIGSYRLVTSQIPGVVINAVTMIIELVCMHNKIMVHYKPVHNFQYLHEI